MTTITDSTRIEDIIDLIVNVLEINRSPDWSEREKRVVIATLQDNWIYNFRALRRLNPKTLSELPIPVLLREELGRILEPQKVRPLIQLYTPQTNTLTIEHSGITNSLPGAFSGHTSSSNSVGRSHTTRQPQVQQQFQSFSSQPLTSKQTSPQLQLSTTQSQQKFPPATTSMSAPPSQGNPPKHNTQDSRYYLDITQQQKEYMRKTFSQLISLHDPNDASKDGVRMFSEMIYPTLFKQSPTTERLFQDIDMEAQSRAITNIMGWVVNNLDKMEQLAGVLAQLGGRHEIYGVKQEDFKQFSIAVPATLKLILGPVVVHKEVVEAWEQALVKISELMRKAGLTVKSGFRSELLRQRSNGSWDKSYLSLTLDTLYIFKDEAYTQLHGQYPLRGVQEINFPRDSAIKNCFELNSVSPPFQLRLGTESLESFEEWISELEWRVKAIQRVFLSGDSSSLESDSSEESGSDIGSKVRLDARKRSRQIKHKISKKAQSKKSEHVIPEGLRRTQSSYQDGLIVNLTETQRQLIRKSWEAINNLSFTTSAGVVIKGPTRLYEEFYKRFFAKHPTGMRLFEMQGLESQGRALVKMLALIVNSVEKPGEQITHLVKTMGGRHEIYGVTATDYKEFADAMCATVNAVLGKEAGADVTDAWFKVMMELSAVMLDSAKNIRQNGFYGVIFRKLGTQNWRKSFVKVDLDMINIFKDDKEARLKSALPFIEVSDIDENDGTVEAPPSAMFSLMIKSNSPTIALAFATKDELKLWLDELMWRIAAVQRAYREDDAVDSSKGGQKKGGGLFWKKKTVSTGKFGIEASPSHV